MNDDKSIAISKVSIIAFIVALVAGLMAALSGFGSRWDWWHFNVGFTMLRWAVYVGIVGVISSVIGIFAARPLSGQIGLTAALLGLILSSLVVAVPVSYLLQARTVPPIHDITTDTQNPPQFEVIVKIRDDAPNPIEYGGPDIAKQQTAAYPAIRPLTFEFEPDTAFKYALKAAQSMGWTIHAADKTKRKIEATDTTFWFGFKDDIVIRIQATDMGSRMDVRSLSRVGTSDVGKNAERIRNYFDELQTVIRRAS